MNRYLLDTHVLLWWLGESRRLSDEVKRLIAEAPSIFVSAAAIWEITIKQSLGRLQMPADLLQMIDEQGMTILPIDARHAFAVGELPYHHQDPFDRIQVAQALCEGLTLVSFDKRLHRYDVPVVGG